MDTKSFRKLCASLGSLTGPQLKKLWTALRSLDARMQAIDSDREAPRGFCLLPALQFRREHALGLDADRRPADAMPIMQADVFSNDRHGHFRHPFAGPLSSDGRRHVRRPSPFVSRTGQGTWPRQDDHLALAPEDHPRLARFGRFPPWRRGRSGREVLPGVPQGLAASGSDISAIRSIIRNRNGCVGWTINARERNCRPASRSIRSRFSRWPIARAPDARASCPTIVRRR